MPDNRRAASSERCMIVIVCFAFVWNSIVTKSGGFVLSKAWPGESRAPPPGRRTAGRATRPSLHRISHQPVTVLELRLGRDWESPPIAERLGGDLDSRRRLLPLVFAALNHADDSPHQIQIEMAIASNLFGRAQLLHEVFENRIEHIVGWE